MNLGVGQGTDALLRLGRDRSRDHSLFNLERAFCPISQQTALVYRIITLDDQFEYMRLLAQERTNRSLSKILLRIREVRDDAHRAISAAVEVAVTAYAERDAVD